jgi:hypothetical protein
MSFMNSAKNKPLTAKASKLRNLQTAARDFRFLLNRGYPRKAALELVGNRYGLISDERHLLHRGAFSNSDSESRRKKKVFIGDVHNNDLAIDGHNVLITVEAGISRRPLVLGDDGFIRDISGLSGSFKKTETTEKAIQFIIRAIKKIMPSQILFLLDAPISKSGELAEVVRNYLRKEGIPGDAMAVKVPERILIGFPGVVATSDTAIIDQSKRVLDLAAHVLRKNIELKSPIRLNKKKRSVGKR